MRKQTKTTGRKNKTDYNFTCPSCRSPAVQVDKEILCESCDSIFVIMRKGGYHVRRMGVLKSLDDRVSDLEDKTKQDDKKDDIGDYFW